LAQTLLPAGEGEVLELMSYGVSWGARRTRWIWLVLCRRTRQVVAWTWGQRDQVTCEELGQGAPSYKNAFCYSDLLVAYQNVLERKQHQACTKQEGQTNHIERFNLTLRQRLGRLVRKTLSFSKSLFMHILSIRLFLHSYNQGQAQNYNASRAT
jgi:IS1 family transposase